MINYQGQMYGVVKTFGGGRRVDRSEEEFFKALAARKANNNINISINVDANEVLSTILKYVENQYNHKEESKEVQNNDLVEGIYFK